MKEVTDLLAVKEAAKKMLAMDFAWHDGMGAMVNHPFCTLPPFVNRNGVVDDPVAAKRWREQVAAKIDDAFRARDIFSMVETPYWEQFFDLVKEHLCAEDFAYFLRGVWTRDHSLIVKDTTFSREQMISMFKQCGKAHIMSEDENDDFNALPDEVAVYCGVPHGADPAGEYVWTTERGVAKWDAKQYAKQILHNNKAGDTYSAVISKADILALFSDLFDQSVILDPVALKNVTQI